MPEMPEVQGLVELLRGRVTGVDVARVTVANVAALKTYDPPIDALTGTTITGAARHGKFVDLSTTGPHLVFHLAKAGWLRWYDELPKTVIKPGRSPIALRVALGDGSGFDLTEAGTKKSLSVYVVRDPSEVPGVARLGPDPLDPGFSRDAFAALLAARRTQIKGVLRDQSILAGVGNAYSDEILQAARLSPFKLAGSLTDDEVTGLFEAIRTELTSAIDRAVGEKPANLKDGKRSTMRVHGRKGEACPTCGTPIAEVSFADSFLNYCPSCQTGGKLLADRRLSKLLK